MSIKIRIVTIIATFSSGVLPINGSAQHLFNPQVIEKLDDVFEDAKLEWTYSNHSRREESGTLTDKGLVLISDDRNSIRTVNERGISVWEKPVPGNATATGLDSSRDGRYLCLWYIKSSDVTDYYQILTAEGQTLWGDDYPEWPSGPAPVFSESGDYTIFRYNHITVSETGSGRILWRLGLESGGSSDPRASVRDWGPDKLVFVDRRMNLHVTALATGEAMWKLTSESWRVREDRGYLTGFVPSKDGSRLVVSVYHGSEYSETEGFDQYGGVLWRWRSEGREIPLGITPDNRFMASVTYTKTNKPSRPSLTVRDMKTGAEVWKIPQANVGRSAAIMNNRMFFHSNAEGTLVISLDNDGQLTNQFLVADKFISYYGFRTDRQLAIGQKAQRVVFLFVEGYGTQRTFHIESMTP